jgi:hypothetical protein
MSGHVVLLRSRQSGKSWPAPRKPERIAPDEREWIDSLSDEELVDLVRGLARVERAVDSFRKAKKGKAA